MVVELERDEADLLQIVKDFVEREVKPQVHALEHANTYPEALIEQMKELGIFGLAIDEPYGFGRVSSVCYALVTEELARGWMSLAGAHGRTHRCREAPRPVRDGRSEAAIPPTHGDRRTPGNHGAHRTRRRVRSAGDAHGRATPKATTTQ